MRICREEMLPSRKTRFFDQFSRTSLGRDYTSFSASTMSKRIHPISTPHGNVEIDFKSKLSYLHLCFQRKFLQRGVKASQQWLSGGRRICPLQPERQQFRCWHSWARFYSPIERDEKLEERTIRSESNWTLRSMITKGGLIFVPIGIDLDKCGTSARH